MIWAPPQMPWVPPKTIWATPRMIWASLQMIWASLQMIWAAPRSSGRDLYGPPIISNDRLKLEFGKMLKNKSVNINNCIRFPQFYLSSITYNLKTLE